MKTALAQEFLHNHLAEADLIEYATYNCSYMQDVWDKAKPEWLLWVATRVGVLTVQERRLFSCWCGRQFLPFLKSSPLTDIISVSEQYVLGIATDSDLSSAWWEAHRCSEYPQHIWNGVLESARTSIRGSTSDMRAASHAFVWFKQKTRELSLKKWSSKATKWDSVITKFKRSRVNSSKYLELSRESALESQAEYLRKNCSPSFVD
jgi:hypothetical protein